MAPTTKYLYSFVNDKSLVLQYDLVLDSANKPSPGDFSVKNSGNIVPVTDVSVSGREVTLTLQSSVTAGSDVTVAYTDPTDGNDTNAIQTTNGYDASSLDYTTVDNPNLDTLSDATTPTPLFFHSYFGEVFTATGTKLDSATVSLQLPLLPLATSFRVLLVDLNKSGEQYSPKSVLSESDVLNAEMNVIGPQNFTANFDYSGLTAGEQYAVVFDGVAENTPLGSLVFTSANTYNEGFLIRYTRAGGSTRADDFAADWTEDLTADLGVRLTMSGGISPPPPPPPPPSTDNSSTVDGAPVNTSTIYNGDGTASTVVKVPVVTAERSESVGNNNVADIPLAGSSGSAVLSVQVPTGYGLTASGSTTPKAAGNSLTDLVREIKNHTNAGSNDQTQLTGGGSGFLQGLSADTPLIVQTITPSVAFLSNTAPDAPLVITGTPAAAGGPQTALVIDTRGLPTGSAIQLQNVNFAAVIGAVTVTGGDGSQTVWGDGANQTIILGADDDTLHGGGGDDFVGSKTGNDVLYGDDGNDTVQGGEEHDRLFGNTGADVLFGNTGADTLFGGQGEDLLFGGQDDDRLSGDLGTDTLHGDAGNDVLMGGLTDISLADTNGDLLLGNSGTDLLFGNAGADTLYGGQDADTLFGGLDGDLLFGDLGNDALSGDRGADTLTGGAGADLFVFASGSGKDMITDFNAAEGDRIRLADGQGYSLRSDGIGNAVIVFSNEDEVTLRGVTQNQVQAGWFIGG